MSRTQSMIPKTARAAGILSDEEGSLQVTTTTFTVAEYCAQMGRDEIRVNREYQRSPKVWPTAARSYLIDTMLQGYPIPKLTLFQITDLRTRSTIKEIVDGQQRSQAIYNYVNDGYRLGTQAEFGGRKFNQLPEPQQQQLLEYQLSVDILVGATQDNIRQLFRRINSYTVPLNKQETRHAVFQGAFKWFIVRLTEKYAQSLKELGVYREAQLSRMADAELFSELSYALVKGIETSSQTKLDTFYREQDETFALDSGVESRFDNVFTRLMTWTPIHDTALMRSYNFYALFLALTHALQPVNALQGLIPQQRPVTVDDDVATTNLTAILAGIESPAENDWLREFLDAQSAGTNVQTQRATRVKWFSRALRPPVLP
jgi:hypothetical protein